MRSSSTASVPRKTYPPETRITILRGRGKGVTRKHPLDAVQWKVELGDWKRPPHRTVCDCVGIKTWEINRNDVLCKGGTLDRNMIKYLRQGFYKRQGIVGFVSAEDSGEEALPEGADVVFFYCADHVASLPKAFMPPELHPSGVWDEIVSRKEKLVKNFLAGYEKMVNREALDRSNPRTSHLLRPITTTGQTGEFELSLKTFNTLFSSDMFQKFSEETLKRAVSAGLIGREHMRPSALLASTPNLVNMPDAPQRHASPYPGPLTPFESRNAGPVSNRSVMDRHNSMDAAWAAMERVLEDGDILQPLERAPRPPPTPLSRRTRSWSQVSVTQTDNPVAKRIRTRSTTRESADAQRLDTLDSESAQSWSNDAESNAEWVVPNILAVTKQTQAPIETFEAVDYPSDTAVTFLLGQGKGKQALQWTARFGHLNDQSSAAGDRAKCVVCEQWNGLTDRPLGAGDLAAKHRARHPFDPKNYSNPGVVGFVEEGDAHVPDIRVPRVIFFYCQKHIGQLPHQFMPPKELSGGAYSTIWDAKTRHCRVYGFRPDSPTTTYLLDHGDEPELWKENSTIIDNPLDGYTMTQYDNHGSVDFELGIQDGRYRIPSDAELSKYPEWQVWRIPSSEDRHCTQRLSAVLAKIEGLTRTVRRQRLRPFDSEMFVDVAQEFDLLEQACLEGKELAKKEEKRWLRKQQIFLDRMRKNGPHPWWAPKENFSARELALLVQENCFRVGQE